MTHAEALVFLFQEKGRLSGDIGHWRDTLRLFSDGTLRGETSGHFTSSDPGNGRWSLDEDGTLHLFVNWRLGGRQDSVGKLYVHEGYVYQMDGQDASRSWLYRFKM